MQHSIGDVGDSFQDFTGIRDFGWSLHAFHIICGVGNSLLGWVLSAFMFIGHFNERGLQCMFSLGAIGSYTVVFGYGVRECQYHSMMVPLAMPQNISKELRNFSTWQFGTTAEEF